VAGGIEPPSSLSYHLCHLFYTNLFFSYNLALMQGSCSINQAESWIQASAITDIIERWRWYNTCTCVSSFFPTRSSDQSHLVSPQTVLSPK